ncbi:transglutaminase family protein [Novosphingobium sp. FSY-8]|uniref:Transglutaminase family protein n=1 Tax=Novosphingobium ovatum TaxID=1908523 RepID=A0ABW9XFX2_9SPHN|nr:transglutaminase family protein [Novosphingobium ovatum]NBC37450.1 transglutaminase family protein [Novosphingobium ovatum]
MRIAIEHQTRYCFDQPVWHGVKRLRLRPRNCAVQSVVDWDMQVEGGLIEAAYEDHNLNATALVSFGNGEGEITITCRGTVDTRDAAGVVGAHTGFMPLWLLSNHTELTAPGPKLRALASRFERHAGREDNLIGMLHDLSAAVADAVAYAPGHTSATTTAEQALVAGRGVCQDHAHVFIGAARELGLPARYVSGYLLMPDRVAQDAGHGWAEVYVAGLGWLAFDVSNAICPNDLYVRLAVGADYRDAAPVTSLSQGGGDATLSVTLNVAAEQQIQQQAQQQMM